MFIQFLFHMRQRGLSVGLTEWMTVVEGLAKGLHRSSLTGFYDLCRCLCVKREAEFDLYDQCFAEFFRGVEVSEEDLEDVLSWLEDPVFPRELSDEERQALEALDLDELKKNFRERLQEQTERHDGGNKWVGTGGTSPFGHGGYHPSGVRLGGPGRQSRAVQIAEKRAFANLRADRVVDTRSFGVALKKLRHLSRLPGRDEELDLDASIDATAKNAGDIELVFRPERRNSVKLLLLMDVGGSMTPFTVLTERLFSAASSIDHFRALESYFFHNCPYESLYQDIQRRETVPTEQVLRHVDAGWSLMIVGDAAMGPYELTMPGGAIEYWHQNDEPGIAWLRKLRERVPSAVWLNPRPPEIWGIPSTRMIQEVFPAMFPLTPAGIEDAVEELRRMATVRA